MLTEQEILDMYLSGKSILRISKENSIPYAKIQLLLYRNKVDIRGGRGKILTEDEEKDVCNKYSFGMSIIKISEIYGIDRFTVKLALLKNGIDVKRRTYRSVNSGFIENYFDKIDNEYKAYYLGLLITDGSVDDKRIRLSLKAEDKYILDKLSEEIGVKHLYYDDRKSGLYSLEAHSKHMVESLNKYGVIQNKTYLLKEIPFELIDDKYLNHFLRGIFDGDGCISISRKEYRIYISEYNYSLVEQIRDIIDSKINKTVHNRIVKTNCWVCTWHKKQDIRSVLDFLYKDATIYLTRKYDRYLSFLESYNK